MHLQQLDGVNGDARIAVQNTAVYVDLPADSPSDVVATVTRLALLVERLTERCVQLQTALDSRIVIEQAKGVLAERYGVSTDDAFQLLRRSARRHRIKLHTLAGAVVASPETPASVDSLNGNGNGNGARVVA